MRSGQTEQSHGFSFLHFHWQIAKRAQLEKLKRDLVKSYFIVHCLVVWTFNFILI